MNRLQQTFGKARVVLPVVHVESTVQAERNVAIAVDAGADGVFLINHAMRWRELLEIHTRIKRKFGDLWIGVNCLDLSPIEVFQKIDATVDGVWVDNSGVHEGRTTQEMPTEILDAIRRTRWPGLYFGGVAFKYQRAVNDLEGACRLAARYMDVVTTSGPGTGRAAEPKKIEIMKSALGDHPLAIASGITPQNVADYLPHCDCFLVATGISRAFDELDPELALALTQKVRAYVG